MGFKVSALSFAFAWALTELCPNANALTCQELLSHSSKIEEVFRQGIKPIRYVDLPVTPVSLFAAHRTGFLPEREAVWALPEERGVVPIEEIRISASGRQRIAHIMKLGAKIMWNKATDQVIEGCAGMPRDEGNLPWMTPEVVAGYKALRELGFVFSVELWSSQGDLVAGFLGILSNGHVEGISRFRNLKHPLSDGAGHALAAAERMYFARRGLKILDVEVAAIGLQRKQDVVTMSRDEFAKLLTQQNAETPIFFDNAEPGNPLPSFESDFFKVFEDMQARRNYRWTPH